MSTSVVGPAILLVCLKLNFVVAVCCDVVIFITVKASYVRAIACHVSWHWKHLSSSLDMVLTDDGGNKVDVSCWPA